MRAFDACCKKIYHIIRRGLAIDTSCWRTCVCGAQVIYLNRGTKGDGAALDSFSELRLMHRVNAALTSHTTQQQCSGLPITHTTQQQCSGLPTPHTTQQQCSDLTTPHTTQQQCCGLPTPHTTQQQCCGLPTPHTTQLQQCSGQSTPHTTQQPCSGLPTPHTTQQIGRAHV